MEKLEGSFGDQVLGDSFVIAQRAKNFLSMEILRVLWSANDKADGMAEEGPVFIRYWLGLNLYFNGEEFGFMAVKPVEHVWWLIMLMFLDIHDILRAVRSGPLSFLEHMEIFL